MRTKKTTVSQADAPSTDIADILAALGGASAPIIFADGVTTYGAQDGFVNVTLQAERHVVLPSGPTSDSVVVAHLRLTSRAVQGLRNMLAGLDQQIEAGRRKAN